MTDPAPSGIPLWVDLRHIPLQRRLPFLKEAAKVGIEHVLLGRDDPHLERKELAPILVDGRNTLKNAGRPIGRLIQMRSGRDQQRAAAVKGIVLVDSQDWTVIPLENLIAARRDRPGTLYALARTVREARLFRDTLEVGVHGVVLAPETAGAIAVTKKVLQERQAPHTALASGKSNADEAATARGKAKPGTSAKPVGGMLEHAKVTAVQDAGMGDRVCIDTTSLFHDGEGLLIGSTARSFALVHAENIETEYVRARPFRVNAGAVHSYLLAPAGKTRYLSELAAGDDVLAVDRRGKTRTLTIGRAKIERRPHTLIKWTHPNGAKGSAVLQTAETVRLVGTDHAPVAITKLKEGDSILVHAETEARHFGMPVDEFLEER